VLLVGKADNPGGLPVQVRRVCAVAMAHHAPDSGEVLSPRKSKQMRTVLADGSVVDNRPPGMVLDRSLGPSTWGCWPTRQGPTWRTGWTVAEYDATRCCCATAAVRPGSGRR